MPKHEKFAENVAMSPEQLARAQQVIDASVASDHLTEAAKEAEELVAIMGARWEARGFTFEQMVFSLALATINFRETVPEAKGGKEAFDKVAHEARKYYDANK
jgi:hypothetical protein